MSLKKNQENEYISALKKEVSKMKELKNNYDEFIYDYSLFIQHNRKKYSFISYSISLRYHLEKILKDFEYLWSLVDENYQEEKEEPVAFSYINKLAISHTRIFQVINKISQDELDLLKNFKNSYFILKEQPKEQFVELDEFFQLITNCENEILEDIEKIKLKINVKNENKMYYGLNYLSKLVFYKKKSIENNEIFQDDFRPDIFKEEV